MAGPTPRAVGSREHRKDDMCQTNSHCAPLIASLSPTHHRRLGEASNHPSEDAGSEGLEVAACGGREPDLPGGGLRASPTPRAVGSRGHREDDM